MVDYKQAFIILASQMMPSCATAEECIGAVTCGLKVLDIPDEDKVELIKEIAGGAVDFVSVTQGGDPESDTGREARETIVEALSLMSSRVTH